MKRDFAMDLSRLISIIITICFLYFILSVIASSIQEMIAGFLAQRANTVLSGIQNLLLGKWTGSAAARDLAQRIVGHELISGIAVDGKPSYVPAEHFSAAVLDVLVSGSTSNAMISVARAVADLPDSGLKSVLSTLLRQNNLDIGDLKSGIEDWYNNGMDRLSGIYKRNCQAIIFLIGFGLALLLNVDAVRVVNGLTHSDYGAAIAQSAEKYIAAHDGLDQTLSQHLDQLGSLSVNIGWHTCATSPVPCVKGSLPFLGPFWSAVGTVIGWLLSAVLISFGGPFWFDLAKTFVNIRSSGPKPQDGVAPLAKQRNG